MAHQKLSDSDVIEIRERAARGAKDIDLAAAFGLSRPYVLALRIGVERREAGGPLTIRKRPKNPLYPEILAARAQGMSLRAVAKHLGCNVSLVNNICERKKKAEYLDGLEREVKELRAEVAALRASTSET